VKRTLRRLAPLLALLAVCLPARAWACSVTTDKPEYSPGETATITGTGFAPNETVDLDLQKSCGCSGVQWSVQADENGGFVTTYLVVDDDLGVTLTVRATGRSSGCTATTTFIDGNVKFQTAGLPAGVSVSVAVTYDPPGPTSSASATVTFTSPGPSTPALAVQNNTSVSYTYPATITVGSTVYTFVSGSPTSPFTSGTGETVATGTYAEACTPNSAPTISGCTPGNIDLGCNPASIPGCDPGVTASDNCGPVSVSCDVSDTANGCQNTRTITYTATNSVGTTTCVVTYTWTSDGTAPTATQGAIADCYADAAAANQAALDATTGLADNCDPSPTKTILQGAGDCATQIIVRVSDACGNHTDYTYSTKVDAAAPTIECPPSITVPGDKDPTLGWSALVDGEKLEVGATDNCPGTLTVACKVLVPNAATPIDLDDLDPVDDGDYLFPVGTSTITCTATDSCGNSSQCSFTVTVAPRCLVTSSSLCTFDIDPWRDGRQFRLIFTPDVKNLPYYKLTASNPGQFFYNAVVTGTPGDPIDLTFTIPAPFVTQGAMPLHLYDGVGVSVRDGAVCLTPGAEIASFPATIIQNPLGATVSTAQWGMTIPPSGVAYINLHLDYGLKGTAPYASNGSGSALSPDLANVLILDNDEYTFATSCGEETCCEDTVRNQNVFKRNPGVVGSVSRTIPVFDTTALEPLPGSTVTLRNPAGTLVGTATADEDGFYQINYKHTGKAATYTLRVVTIRGTQTLKITLKANALYEADFRFP